MSWMAKIIILHSDPGSQNVYQYLPLERYLVIVPSPPLGRDQPFLQPPWPTPPIREQVFLKTHQLVERSSKKLNTIFCHAFRKVLQFLLTDLTSNGSTNLLAGWSSKRFTN